MSQKMTERLLVLWLLSSSCRCQVLQGPGSNARIIPFSDRIAPDELPVEHRSGDALLLPDVFSVSRNVSSELDVDLFFSLFFVFLNDQFEESNSSYTIFAPAGLATSEAARWLRTEEQLTEELLLNHIVMGEHLRPELMTSWNVVRTTLGGLEVSFKNDENGELWVNDARIVAWKEEGKALIIALEDYLFKQEVRQEVGKEDFEYYDYDEIFPKSESENAIDIEEQVPREWGDVTEEVDNSLDNDKAEFIPTPRKSQKNCTKIENKSGLSIFKSITVCTEKVKVANIIEQKDLEPSLRKLDSSLTFLEEVENELSFIRGGPGLTYFLSYANKTGLDQLLRSKKTYTVLAPVDEAFQSWHPIDWGFNPFAVSSFVNVTLVNHVIEGSVSLQPDSDQTSLTTVGDREVLLTVRGENTYANGVLVRGGMTLQGGRGSVLFLDEVLWIDHDVVEELNSKFGFLESGPPINTPWNNSQFLSHSLAILEKIPHTSLTAFYMNTSHTLGEYAPGGDGAGYTLFAPTDEAFAALCPPGSASCDSILQEGQRMDLLIGHLVGGQVVLSDNNDTSVVKTMAGRNITLLITPAGTFVLDDGSPEGPAAIIGDPIFVFNLGTLIIIDKVLFGSEINFTSDNSQETIPDIPETTITNTIEPLDKYDDVSEDSEEYLSTQATLLLDASINSDLTSDMNDNTTDDDIIFPETSYVEDIETTTEEDIFTPDTSSIVFKVKELLAKEKSQDNFLQKEHLLKPREKRIVYINNQRVEIEDEELL